MSKLRKRPLMYFAQVPSPTADDGDLSYRALGVLTHLLNRPDGWDVRSEALAASGEGREGREAIRTALRELGCGGYYRLERQRLRNGQFQMATAISPLPDREWAAQWEEFEGKAVPMIEQKDGSFKIKRKDGTLTDDGFSDEFSGGFAPPPTDGDAPPAEEETAGHTGNGFLGPGGEEAPSTGDGFPDAGSPDSGGLGPITSTETQDSEIKNPPLTSFGAPPGGGAADEAAEGGEEAPPDGKPARPARSGKRGTRLPEDWAPSEKLLDRAAAELPLLTPKALTDHTTRFVNHYVSTSGAKGVKVDWDRTWWNWVLKEHMTLEERAGRTSSGTLDPALLAAAAETVDPWCAWWQQRGPVLQADRDGALRLVAEAFEAGATVEQVRAALQTCQRVCPPRWMFGQALLGEPIGNGYKTRQQERREWTIRQFMRAAQAREEGRTGAPSFEQVVGGTVQEAVKPTQPPAQPYVDPSVAHLFDLSGGTDETQPAIDVDVSGYFEEPPTGTVIQGRAEVA